MINEKKMTEDDLDAIEKGLKTGYQYQCKGCNYIGALVLEKEF